MRVLITQGSLVWVAGSEVVTYELVEQLRLLGHEVHVATHHATEWWIWRLNHLGASVRNVDDPGLQSEIVDNPFDVAWIHHQVIPPALLENPGSTRFVFEHMSHFHPLEFPIMAEVETALADLVLFPAQEGLDWHREHGALSGLDDERLRVLGNPAPDHFLDVPRRRRTKVRDILIVSNHIPTEIRDLLALDQDTFRFTVRGRQDDEQPELLIPDDLAAADAVITIGKTVQYAILAGIPVFCYDHLGGPGWLTEDNFDRAAHHNFSGRGFGSMSGDELLAALQEGAKSAGAVASRFRVTHAERFTLSRVLESLFERLDALPPRVSGDISEFQRLRFLDYQKLVGILLREKLPVPIEPPEDPATAPTRVHKRRRSWLSRLTRG